MAYPSGFTIIIFIVASTDCMGCFVYVAFTKG